MAYDLFHDYLGLAGLVKSFVPEFSEENWNSLKMSSSNPLSPSSESPLPSLSSWPTVTAPSLRLRSHSRGTSDGYSSDDEGSSPSTPPATGLQPFELSAIMSLSKVYNDQSQRKAHRRKNVSYCVFCKNNDEEPEVYNSHTCKSLDGARTTCPILRAYTCPICGANNDTAHTLKYCPYNIHNDLGSAAIDFITPSASTRVVRT